MKSRLSSHHEQSVGRGAAGSLVRSTTSHAIAPTSAVASVPQLFLAVH